ncbi:hypothetical protein A2334_00785 [Candidatus Roizmanbacteria bacterium RIFOXYB2_FULL_38_10]|uniref:Uncharacterized protein n=1 Tax=Candidatus Roizmanbacteria bacterium RIFOXYD1_FULL_38_12 TaxID=1802093 RepID=A0A1F7L1F6_9BACT|nr:MAG: hypothetical protein A3K47_04080 [Candidatus Roizmanbacteria bacterium RIFOXYA2_FULL_38_14]OGK63936.1 MAG: hypothetical protein A3K27_04080 [Candidatus Roizmanbacteria bacterium RIFOXYA1_FULL_37_12]OGK65782.1 MAG: hypothetical protein A3K38_04080 [Candidatus Roizmanbacteria bacterium RIFOXYB1_FULL_40_23]OGK68890.1 MAG: hypothetical protein A2334_00785 [Candidatus Roizmanbacteria bacterium RIFOXYB2_FULL_38_10]OGK70187.1 MAG: hypothetical protein A3K21_04085 [Candidatus Roizmanbacteria ba
MTDTTTSKESIAIKHIAAALAPEAGRAPILNKEIAALAERQKKLGGKSMFEAELAENEEDTMVNFDQMRRVLDDEKKRVDAETDPGKKADLLKRHDRLMRRYGVYDKLLNNEGFLSMTPEERGEMVNIMVNLPGFCESISLVSGGRLTIDQVKQFVSGKGGVVVTPDERKAINELVATFLSSDKLGKRIAKNLSALSMPAEDAVKASEIENRREKIKNKAEKQKEKDDADKTITTVKGKFTSTDELNKANYWYNRLNAQVAKISDETYRPIKMTQTEVQRCLTRLNADITAYETRYPDINKPPVKGVADVYADRRAKYDSLVNSLSPLTYLDGELTDTSLEQRFQDMKDYSEATTKKGSLDAELVTINQAEREMLQLEGERSQYADKYRRKMDTALSEEMKRYWNEITLTAADRAVQADEAMKAEGKQKEADEKKAREDKAKEMLDKYLKISFLKYKNGKVAGWDDRAIKDFMHKDLLSQSPRKLARGMLERIYRERYSMPVEYGKEIKRMFEDMGLGKGTPPLALRDVLNQLPDTLYDSIAAEKVPDMLGYAWARGYYFDRMKLKKGEAEFLRHAYGPDSGFFDKAIAGREKEIEAAAKMLGEYDLLDGGALSAEKLKAIVGKDWTQGSKRLMKVLAVAGGIGAGVFTLGGGFALNAGQTFNLATQSARVINTLANVGAVPSAALGATSRVSEKGINWVATHATNILRKIP